jgi:hypothetical protein
MAHSCEAGRRIRSDNGEAESIVISCLVGEMFACENCGAKIDLRKEPLRSELLAEIDLCNELDNQKWAIRAYRLVHGNFDEIHLVPFSPYHWGLRV